MGVVTKLKTRVKAHAAAAGSGWPARDLKVVLVSGQDGGQLTVAYLAAMLRRSGERVGIITPRYIEVAGEQGSGSDQADVLGDAFRLHKLLQQMKKADCSYVVIEVPAVMPAHRFVGITPALLAVRRCGDKFLAGADNTQRAAQLRKLLALKPRTVVWNRDDPCFDLLKQYVRSGSETMMTFGTHEKAECRMTHVELHPKGSAVELLIDHQTELQLASHLSGKQAIYSMVTAAAAAYLLHVSITAIEDGALGLGPQPGILHYVSGERPYQVVVDSSVTPEGLAETLETLKHFSRNRVVCVLSANLTQPSDWRVAIGDIVSAHADRIIVTDGDYLPSESAQVVRDKILQGVLSAGGEARTEEVADRQAAFEKAVSIARRNDIVVVACASQRPYYLHGDDRVVFDDAKKLEELIS